jgi:hypothetical protein
MNEQDRSIKKRFDIGNIVQLVQVIVLVVSGCWAFYQFLSFTSHSQKLQLENAKLDNEYKKVSRALAEADLAKSSQEYRLKDNELKYASALADIQMQKNKQESFIREIEMKYTDSRLSLEIQKSQQDATTKEHELRKEIASIYERIVQLSKDFIILKNVYAEKKTPDNYNNILMLKSVLDLQKDNFKNLEAKLAKLEKREVRKIQIEFIPPEAPTGLRIMRIIP